MAEPETPNGEIPDPMSEANLKVLGDAPAVAMGNLYQATALALSNAAHNANASQQQSWITMQAATVQGVAMLLSLTTASAATQTIFGEEVQQES